MRCRRGARADAASAGAIGVLDATAIARVVAEAWPDPRDADELHDALVTAGFLTDAEAAGRCRDGATGSSRLARQGRAASRVDGARRPSRCWVAAERLPELVSGRSRAAGHAIRRIVAPPGRAAAVVDARHARSSSCCAAASRSSVRSTRGRRSARTARRWPQTRPSTRCSRSKRKGSSCAARSRPAGRRRMVRPPAAGAHPPATRCTGCARRSSRCRRPTSCGSCSPGSTSRRGSRVAGPGRRARRARAARRLRAGRRRVGAARAAGPRRGLRPADARRVVLRRRSRVGRALSSAAALRAGQARAARPIRATPIALFLRDHARRLADDRGTRSRRRRPAMPRHARDATRGARPAAAARRVVRARADGGVVADAPSDVQRRARRAGRGRRS